MPKNTSKILIPLATAAVAAAVTVGSGADWTASVPTTTSVGAGTISVDKENGATLNVQSMKPGDTRSGELTITNSGTVDADIAMSEDATGNAFGSSLTIQIQRDGHVIYPVGGSASDFGAIGGLNNALGSGDVTMSDPLLAEDDPTTDDNEKQTVFTFVVKFDASDLTHEGATADIGYDFTFTPVDGTDTSNAPDSFTDK